MSAPSSLFALSNEMQARRVGHGRVWCVSVCPFSIP